MDGIIIFNQITAQDLKDVIKKNDFKFRGKLETKEKKLNLLNLTLKKYFSLKISPRYKEAKYTNQQTENNYRFC